MQITRALPSPLSNGVAVALLLDHAVTLAPHLFNDFSINPSIAPSIEIWALEKDNRSSNRSGTMVPLAADVVIHYTVLEVNVNNADQNDN